MPIRDNTPGVNTSGATAQDNEILQGKTAFLADGKPHTGTMPNRGNSSFEPSGGGEQTIPEGYYDGTGKVSGHQSFLDGQENARQGDAQPSHVLAPHTFTSAQGSNQQGTMENKGAPSIVLTPQSKKYNLSQFYEGGEVKIETQSKTAQPLGQQNVIMADEGKVLEFVAVRAVTKNDGAIGESVYNEGRESSLKGNALSAAVLQGYTFSSASAGVNQEGSMPNRGSATQTVTPQASSNQIITLNEGYYSASTITINQYNCSSNSLCISTCYPDTVCDDCLDVCHSSCFGDISCPPDSNCGESCICVNANCACPPPLTGCETGCGCVYNNCACPVNTDCASVCGESFLENAGCGCTNPLCGSCTLQH